MWLQQRLKGLPGLLSSSWARRVLVGLLLFLIFYWYLSSDGLLKALSMSRDSGGAAGGCLQNDLHRWVSLVDRGEGVVLNPQTKETVPFVVGNGHFLVDVDSNKLWVASSSQPGSAPVHQTDYGPVVRLQIPGNTLRSPGNDAVVQKRLCFFHQVHPDSCFSVLSRLCRHTRGICCASQPTQCLSSEDSCIKPHRPPGFH